MPMITTLLQHVKDLLLEYKTHGVSVLTNARSTPQFCRLMDHLAKVDLEHVGMNIGRTEDYFKKDSITYFNILEEQDFCVGVFCLGQGSSLDFHDHPNMLVLSKYLIGSVQYRSLDLVDRSQQVSLPQALYQDDSAEVVGKKLDAIVRGEKVLQAGDINYLTPELGNIHKITALENTAFLDILLPNYNEVDRYCNFYTEVPMEIIEDSDVETNDDNISLNSSPMESEIGDGDLTSNNERIAVRGFDNTTTLFYALPSLELPINLVQYKGEKFEYNGQQADSDKQNC